MVRSRNGKKWKRFYILDMGRMSRRKIIALLSIGVVVLCLLGLFLLNQGGGGACTIGKR